MRNRIIILLCSLCCLLNIQAQDTTLYDNRSGVSHWIVSDVLQDRQGFIWLSTWNGLNRYDGYVFRQVKSQPGDGTKITSEVIRQMTLDPHGNIICSTDNGLFMLDVRSYTLRDINDPKNKVKPHPGRERLCHDSHGNLWRVERYGVTKTTSPHHPAHVVEGTHGVQARAFLKDRHRRWWLATKEDESIRIYDDKNTLLGFLGADGRLHTNATPFNYRAYSIMESRSGDIWIGCKPGALLRLRERNDGSYDISRITAPGLTCDTIYDITEDAKGRLWLATFGGGVQCVTNPAADHPDIVNFLNTAPFRGSQTRVRRIIVTKDGNIVCATTNGIIIGYINNVDIRKSSFQRLTRDGGRIESLSNNAVMDVVSDGRETIYVATENGGIDIISEKSLFSKTPVFRHYNTSNSSLTTDACMSLAMKGDGHLLIVSPDRVMDFIPEKDSTVTFSRNFWNPTSHFSEERPMRLFDGSWLFGQEQGAYIATPHNMESRGYVPPLMFTELHVNGKAPFLGICQRDTVIIGTGDRNFSVSFAALDYVDNSQILYRSRLNGEQWSQASPNHTITFYDIQPGEYILEVQSTDRYGRWTANTKSLTIIVEAHWYETLWARIAAWLLSLALILGVVYTIIYIRNLHRQRRELLEKYLSLLSKPRETEEQPEDTEAEKILSQELSDADSKFLDRVRRYIEENISNSDANIEEMASYAATSRSNLNRKLRSLLDITATQLLIDARLQKARQMLEASAGEKVDIADIAYRCGYSDPHYFSRSFKKKYGVPPSAISSQSSYH